MRADTLIDIHDWKHERKQTLTSGLEISVPERIGTNSDIRDTVHHDEVYEVVHHSLAEQGFLLSEILMEHIARLVLNGFGAAKVHVHVAEPGILPDVMQVGIEIERTRE